MQYLSGQPNIVEIKGAYEYRQSVHLVMELCAGGELFDRIIAQGHYSERAAYGAGVDVWAAGCIFAELLLRRPFLPGSTEIDQLRKIFQAFGTPVPSQWYDMIYLPDYMEFLCLVWYLEPQTIRPGETGIEFAERVRDMISLRAGLKKVPWDGYCHYSF
ncbi:unnamed protein product [Arabidopsis lyrata]|uniref:Protein kinase domain-containing protein n=1 Tax=Arabidopsis lyrata subsp. lyrata TaxID=81972 RepID=D7M724_ARALL|nr:hypothetical protein ARALYDRAFT_908012 [Arabidopsis lyrata subsp. lyrata]CAH8269706.1 unnamed protein product [Arabidopsis lyrata]